MRECLEGCGGNDVCSLISDMSIDILENTKPVPKRVVGGASTYLDQIFVRAPHKLLYAPVVYIASVTDHSTIIYKLGIRNYS